MKSESAVSREQRIAAALVLTASLVIQIGIPSLAFIFHGWKKSLDLATGIMWQVDDATVRPSGNWQRLGAHRLIVQWTYTEGKSYLADDRLPLHPILPDWSRIAKEPWAREVIVGLAGEFDENRARASTDSLAALSKHLSAIARHTGLNIVGWYFPVEVDPTWRGASRLGSVLADLPRPLWISVYDRGNIGPKPLADWLLTCPPRTSEFCSRTAWERTLARLGSHAITLTSYAPGLGATVLRLSPKRSEQPIRQASVQRPPPN